MAPREKNSAATKRKSIAPHNRPSKASKTALISSPAKGKALHASKDKHIKPDQPVKPKDDEELFPRGGASVLSSLEQRQIKIQATHDAFEQAAEDSSEDEPTRAKTPAQRRKTGPRKGALKEQFPDDEKVQDNKIKGLDFKRLVKGTTVFGQIYGITKDGLLLSLPNKMTGNVAVNAISPQLDTLVREMENDDHDGIDPVLDRLTKLFSIGQRLRAYVVSTSLEQLDEKPKAKRRIDVSLRPEQTNMRIEANDIIPNVTLMASVISVEDHGYVMDLGFGTSLRGFLNRKELDPRMGRGLAPGAVCLCAATTSARANVVQLTANTAKLDRHKSTLVTAPSTDLFLPGTRVEVIITDVRRDGVQGKIAGSLDASADAVNSGFQPGSHAQEKFKLGSKHKAMVTFAYPNMTPAQVGVSFEPVKAPTVPPLNLSFFEPGSMWAATVKNVGPNCVWASVTPMMAGRIDLLDLSDDLNRVNNLAEFYAEGSPLAVRVLSVDLKAQHLDLSARDVFAAPKVTDWDSLSVGLVVPGRIVSIKDRGVIVRLSNQLVGYVSLVDLADNFDEVKPSLLKLNQIVRVAVISLGNKMGKIQLSMRPSRVANATNITDPEVIDFESVAEGDVLRGFVHAVSEHGIFVTLGHRVSGLIRNRDLKDNDTYVSNGQLGQ